MKRRIMGVPSLVIIELHRGTSLLNAGHYHLLAYITEIFVILTPNSIDCEIIGKIMQNKLGTCFSSAWINEQRIGR